MEAERKPPKKKSKRPKNLPEFEEAYDDFESGSEELSPDPKPHLNYNTNEDFTNYLEASGYPDPRRLKPPQLSIRHASKDQLDLNEFVGDLSWLNTMLWLVNTLIYFILLEF